MNTWFWVSGALVCGYPVLWLCGSRLWKATAVRATAVARDKLTASEQALEAAATEQTTERDRLHAELKLVINDLHGERDKVSRYFAKISDFERERTEWQRLYHEQSIGHGNAQALMMGTIERMARQLQDKGVRVQIPKVLHEIREEFLSQHEMPARSAIEEAKNLQALQAPQPTAASLDLPASTP